MKIETPKIILFHPGKTGGTSIEHTLKNLYLPEVNLIAKEQNREIMFGMDKEYKCYLQHGDIRLYEKMNIPYQTYKTITTVRRPYERILSCYFYNGKSKRFTFEEFITKELEKCFNSSISRGYSVSHFSPQYTFAYHESYEVDHIIYLENFKDDCAKAGLDVKYHYSKTAGPKQYSNYMDAYNQKTKDIVYSIYKEDFKLYGYEK